MSIRQITTFLLLCSAVTCFADQGSKDAFTFVRIKWTDNQIRFWYGLKEDVPLWAHDYPVAEDHLYLALNAVTTMKVSEDSKVLTFDDDEIFKYPVIYACEIGYITMSDREVETLREYLLRGGFLIVDDFRLPEEMRNWQMQIGRVLPGYQMRKLSLSHPIFHCFYDLSDEIYEPVPYLAGTLPEFWGIFDEQDRMMVLMNYNNDVGDGWELPEGDGTATVQEWEHFSKTAFLLGINYMIYGLTH